MLKDIRFDKVHLINVFRLNVLFERNETANAGFGSRQNRITRCGSSFSLAYTHACFD